MLRAKQSSTATEHQPETLSIVLKRKPVQQQIEEMHKEYADSAAELAAAPRSVAEMHEYYQNVVTRSGGTVITSTVPQDYHPRLTPARVEIETNSIQVSLGEAVARRTAAMTSAVVNVPAEDSSIAAAFAPIIETAERHAISKVDNAQNKRALWIWGAAVVGITAGAIFILGRRSKEENKNN